MLSKSRCSFDLIDSFTRLSDQHHNVSKQSIKMTNAHFLWNILFVHEMQCKDNIINEIEATS
jgi:hypothetical protein